MTFIWAVATHRGLVRTINQDAVFPPVSGRSQGALLAMVADGMGGAVAGDVASRLAVEAAAGADGAPIDRVRSGNRAVYEETLARPELAGMGTTLTLIDLAEDGTARLGHVGDSRAYLLRAGELRRLTRDHTIVEEFVSAGQLAPDQVAAHPQRHVLTRVLGLTRSIPVDTIELLLEVGDRLLLCSDGLSSMVPDGDLAALLARGSPEETVWALVEAANAAGGLDNVTALVVDVVP